MAPHETGHTKDVGYEIGVRRTVPYDLETVWEELCSAPGLATWLGPGAVVRPQKGALYETEDGITGEVRSFRAHDRIRLTWRPAGWAHDTTVQVAILPAASGTTLVFHQERLADGKERSRQRDYWRGVADRFGDLLAGAHPRG